MNVLFNELSYLHAPTNLPNAEVASLLKSLGRAVAFFKALSPVNQVVFWTVDRAIHTDQHKFINGCHFRQILSLVNHEYRVAILFLINRLNYLEVDGVAPFSQPVLKISTAAVPAFLAQATPNLGMLSIFTDQVWCADQVDFHNGGVSTLVNNWPKISLGQTLQQYLTSFESYFAPLIPRIGQSDHPILPYRSISDMMLKEETYTSYVDTLSHGDRLAAFQMVGGTVARINQYIERADLNALNSSKNKKRNIFYNSSLDKYLSIDYEKGAFEFLDKHGIHLGEFNFEGINIGPADTKHRHNIVLKQR